MSVIIDGIGSAWIGLDEEPSSRFLFFDHNTHIRLQGNRGGDVNVTLAPFLSSNGLMSI